MEKHDNIKHDVLEELKNGTPISIVVKKYNIPQSTVSTWLCQLKKSQYIPSQLTVALSAKNNADLINEAEVNIATSISKVVSDDITDEEWIGVQRQISKELQAIVYKTELKSTPQNKNLCISDNSIKIKEITKKWNCNSLLENYMIN